MLKMWPGFIGYKAFTQPSAVHALTVTTHVQKLNQTPSTHIPVQTAPDNIDLSAVACCHCDQWNSQGDVPVALSSPHTLTVGLSLVPPSGFTGNLLLLLQFSRTQ